MNYKHFKSYHELIQILQKRNLIIRDEQSVLAFLKQVHYYRLSAYFTPFQYSKQSNKKDIFKDGVSFENIKDLYQFDCKLKELIFSYLQELEIILRAQISHIHTEKFGPFGYLENDKSLRRKLFKKNSNLYNVFMNKVKKEKERSDEVFIKHIKEKYVINDLPLWALVEILSFGSISKFYELMQKDEQVKILQYFKISEVKIDTFSNWLQTLSYIRNICAHHSRLWNRSLTIKFKTTSACNFLSADVKNDKFFYALSVLALILKDGKIKNSFINLLHMYPKIDTEAMGIPNNWQILSPWNEL